MNLNQALAAYNEAVRRLPLSQPDAWSEYAAPLGLGTAWVLKGYTDLDIDQYTKAAESQQKAVEIIQKVIKPLEKVEEYRLLGQAYSNLGAAYGLGADISFSQGDQKSSLEMLHKASEAFLRCKSQGEKAPNDLILKEQVVKVCDDNNKQILKSL